MVRWIYSAVAFKHPEGVALLDEKETATRLLLAPLMSYSLYPMRSNHRHRIQLHSERLVFSCSCITTKFYGTIKLNPIKTRIVGAWQNQREICLKFFTLINLSAGGKLLFFILQKRRNRDTKKYLRLLQLLHLKNNHFYRNWVSNIKIIFRITKEDLELILLPKTLKQRSRFNFEFVLFLAIN